MLEAGEVGLEKVQSIVSIQKGTTLSGYLLIAGTVLDLISVYCFLCNLIYGQFENSIDGVVLDLTIFHHLIV